VRNQSGIFVLDIMGGSRTLVPGVRRIGVAKGCTPCRRGMG